MITDYDVIVVGAGPAGIAAGIVLAREKLQTLVCDRNRLPIDKACGEGILPTGVSTLEALGVLEHLPQANCHPFLGIRYIAPSGSRAQATFGEGHGLGVTRVALSSALWQRAQREPYLTVLDGCAVRLESSSDRQLVVRIADRTLRARLVVGADGLYSRARRFVEPELVEAGHRRWGLRQRFERAPWTDYVEVYFADGIEAYVTPTASSQISVAFLWDEEKLGIWRRRRDPVRVMLDRSAELRARLAAARPMDPTRAAGPLERRIRRRTADGILLIGDAAGYVDAATGEGVSLALAEAMLLTSTVVPAARRARHTGRVPMRRELRDYERAVASLYAPYRRWSRLVVTLGAHRDLSERAVRALSASPAAFQHLLSASMGEKSLWALPPQAAWPLLRGLIQPRANAISAKI